MRFKGYGSEDDMWQFQTVSSRGRAWKHRTKDEGEVQQRKKIKRSNGTTANSANLDSDERIKKACW